MFNPTNFSGQTLGNYRLYETIGMGGMATVYRGEQLTVQRTVAVKILSNVLANDEEFVVRFRREAETAARLEHPHIVPVYDFGTVGGTLYVVMRYLPGGSLGQRLKKFGLPSLADTVHLLDQVASALDYAHKNGVVHRDIKPANIMLDEEGRAYLGDFGIARLLNTPGTTITTGIGTPAYMAPEQFTGGAVDARTDVYSLGVMLYVMTVGKLPFEADSQLGVAYLHINTPPVAPIKENPALPIGVSDAILKAMAKEPVDRPTTAGALAESFSEAVTGIGAEQRERTAYFIQPLPPSAVPTIGSIASDAPSPPVQVGSQPSSQPVVQPPEGNNLLLIDTRPSQPAKRLRFSLLAGLAILIFLVGVSALVFVVSQIARPNTSTATAAAGLPSMVPSVTILPTKPASSPSSPNSPLPPTITRTAAGSAILVPTRAPNSTLPAGAIRVDGRGVSQVWVPPGCFLMGSDPAQDSSAQPDEMPQHQVCINQGFWLDEYEVTNAAYQQFMDDGGYHKPEFWSSDGWQWLQAKNITGPMDFSGTGSAQQPRVGVSWYEADAYARWRTGALPTEAEWEYAARGPESLIYPWGNTYQTGYANVDESATGGPHHESGQAVGSYEAGKSWSNAYDLAGNIWEWAADWYDPDYYQQRVTNDPPGPASGTTRVLRGGSWLNDPLCARAACRHVNFRGRTPDTRDNAVGIRVISRSRIPSGPPTPTLAFITGQCPGFLPSRLVVGQPARVMPGGGANRLRSEPNGQILGTIQPGTVFNVLEGPRCTDATAWWRIDASGQTGWTAEGVGDVYYLEPLPANP